MKDVLFHLAFPTHNVEAAKRFYVEGLNCTLGRESSHAVTFGFAGHHLVAHLTTEPPKRQQGIYPHHFGLIFSSKDSWEQFLRQAQAKKLSFYQQPRVRFPGTRIEHHTFFLEDPSGNLLEFKHYTYESAILGERNHAAVGDTETEDTD